MTDYLNGDIKITRWIDGEDRVVCVNDVVLKDYEIVDLLVEYMEEHHKLEEEYQELEKQYNLVFEILDSFIGGIKSEKGIAEDNQVFHDKLDYTQKCLEKLKNELENPSDFLKVKVKTEDFLKGKVKTKDKGSVIIVPDKMLMISEGLLEDIRHELVCIDEWYAFESDKEFKEYTLLNNKEQLIKLEFDELIRRIDKILS